MAQTFTDKVLVLLRVSDLDFDFVCPDCGAYVAQLEGVEVAELTDPETYALAGVMANKDDDFLGVPIAHHGRLGTGYCDRKYYFWDINGGRVAVTKVVTVAAK